MPSLRRPPFRRPTSTKFCMLGHIPDIFLGFEFHYNRLKNVGAVGVEILAFPLTWHIAYTTACCYCYRTSRDECKYWFTAVLLNCFVLRQFFTLYFLQHHTFILTVLILFAGESSFEVNIEGDSNVITEHSHDGKPRPYLCTVCDKKFTTKDVLKQHKQIHNVDKLYSCTQCEKRFATRRYLRMHMNVHSSKYKCTECGKCFSSNQNLTVHRRIHSGEKPFECTVCSKRFINSANLAKHSRIHSVEKPYKCHECDKVFSVSFSLTTHMRVHTGDKPYKCLLCDKSFSISSNLQSHKRHAHSNRRPYDCRYCGKMFKGSWELKLHVYTHMGAKPYSCRYCSECFRQHQHLKAHLLKSHNEGTWFTCNTCQKKFSRKCDFKKHLLRHEGVKPYVCDECSKSFFTASNMKCHQLKHSDYKQFCCGSCGEYFKHKQNVVRHFNKCSVKLGYVHIFAKQDWVREQTIACWTDLLLLTQDLSVYSVNYWLYTGWSKKLHKVWLLNRLPQYCKFYVKIRR